jgi:hypothetical protein
MSGMPRLFSLFLAGASDVETEQDVVKRVVGDWNAEHAEARGAYVNLTSWKDSAFPEAGAEPQAILNRQLVDSADIVVGIFWTRFGTPTNSAASGTEEEIQRSIAAGKKVMVYFSDNPIPPSQLDPVQYARIQDFKQRYSSNGLYWSVSSPDDFRDAFRKHLARAIGSLLERPQNQVPSTPGLGPMIPIAFPVSSWLAIVVALNASVRGAIGRIEQLQSEGIAPHEVNESERLALTSPVLARARILQVLAQGGYVQPDPNDFLGYEAIMRGLLQMLGKTGNSAG